MAATSPVHTAPQVGTRSAIVVESLTKEYALKNETVRAVDNVSLTIEQGSFLCIVGPSGCGKSTLLSILAGLDTPTSGSVRLNADDPTRPLTATVFQEESTYPWMSVVDNVAYGLAVRNVPKRERRERAADFVDRVGLGRFKNAYPHQLSGGMRQRVNIARAFCTNPSILLMDEPMASLDEQTKMLLQQDLLELWESSHQTVVFITHSLDEAIVLGDHIAVMTKRPGTLKSIVDINLPRPRHAIEVRNSEDFLEIRRRVWDSLREEFVSLTTEGPDQ